MVKAPTTWAEGVSGGAAAVAKSRRRSSQTGGGTSSSRHQHRTNRTNYSEYDVVTGTVRKRPTSSTYPDTTSSSSFTGEANPLTLSGSAMGVDLSRGVSREEILRRRNKLAALHQIESGMFSSSDRAVVSSYDGGMKRNMGQVELRVAGNNTINGSEDAVGVSVDSGSAGSLPLAVRELTLEVPQASSSQNAHNNKHHHGSSSAKKFMEFECQLNDVPTGRDRRERTSSRSIHSKHSNDTNGSGTRAAVYSSVFPQPRSRSSLPQAASPSTTMDDKYSDEMEGWMMTAGMATATSRAADEDNELDEEYRAVFAPSQKRKAEEHRQRKGSGSSDRNSGREREMDRDRQSGMEATRRRSNDPDGYRARTPERNHHRRSSIDHRRSSIDHQLHQQFRRSSADHVDQDAKLRRMKELGMQLQAIEEKKYRLQQEKLAERLREIEKERRRLEKEEAMQFEKQREMEAAAASGRNPMRRRNSGSVITAGSRLLEELNGLDLAPEQEGVGMHNSAPDLLGFKPRRRSSMATTSRRGSGGSGGECSRKISDLDSTGAPTPSRERERDRDRDRDREYRRRSSREHTAEIDTQDMFDAERSSRKSSMTGSRSRDSMENFNEMTKVKRGKRPSNSDMPQEMSSSHSELDQELLRGLPGMLKRKNSDERKMRLSRENSGDRKDRRSSNQGGKKNSGARDDGRAQRRPSMQFIADQEIARRSSAESGTPANKPRRAGRRGSMQSTGMLSIDSKQSQHASWASAVGEVVRKAERRNSNQRERITAEGSNVQTSSQFKPKVSRRSTMDNSAILNPRATGTKVESTSDRRNSDPSEPQKEFTNVSRRGSTSAMLKHFGVMLESEDIDLGDEPKSKLGLKNLAKKLTLKKGGEPERVPRTFGR